MGLGDFVGGIASGIGKGISHLTGMPIAKSSLGDPELTKILAGCASHVYVLNGGWDNHAVLEYVEVIARHEETGLGDTFQYAKYRIIKGSKKGKTILAIRGTASLNSILQDVGWFFGSANIKIAGAHAAHLASQCDYVCGHSLGGALAEMACSFSGTPGACFNAPGPWCATHNNLCGDKYDGVRFEVHLTSEDAVSHLAATTQAARCSHLVNSDEVKWHDAGTNHPLTSHSMERMMLKLNCPWGDKPLG